MNTQTRGLDVLLQSALRVGPEDRVAFLHDASFTMLAEPVRSACELNAAAVVTIETDFDGISPLDQHLLALVTGSDYNVIVFGFVHNVWHTPERKHAKYVLRKRMASIVCTAQEMLALKNHSQVENIAKLARRLSGVFQPGLAPISDTSS